MEKHSRKTKTVFKAEKKMDITIEGDKIAQVSPIYIIIKWDLLYTVQSKNKKTTSRKLLWQGILQTDSPCLKGCMSILLGSESFIMNTRSTKYDEKKNGNKSLATLWDQQEWC